MPTPEITFRHGACSASVWENNYRKGNQDYTVKNITFQRQYKDKDGKWQSTNSLQVNDIPKAVLVLNKAYEFLTASSYQERQQDGSPGTAPTSENSVTF